MKKKNLDFIIRYLKILIVIIIAFKHGKLAKTMDKIRSENIRDKLCEEQIMTNMNKRRMNWFGHTNRMQPTSLVKKVLEV